MHSSPRLAGLAFLAGVYCLLVQTVTAQLTVASPATADVTATINFGTESVTALFTGGISDRVGLQPNQVIDVTVQLPITSTGRTILIEPVDGGHILSATNNPIVAADGTFRFTFQAGQSPGLYQVSLHDGGGEMGLHFWVLDSQHPEKNPPVINSATNGGAQ